MRCPLHYRSLWTVSIEFMSGRLVGFYSVKNLNPSESIRFTWDVCRGTCQVWSCPLSDCTACRRRGIIAQRLWMILCEGPYCVMESMWGEVRIKKRVRICASSKSAAPDLERWVTSWFAEIVRIEAIVESKLTPGCVCCQVVGSSDFEPGLPRSTWVRGGEMH